MLKPIMTLRDRADFYHRQLPQTMRRYLNDRGIPDSMIERYTLGWNGKAITIPVEDRQGEVVAIKLAKSPFSGSRAPVMETPPGAPVELFGWESLLRQPGRIVICETEFECLVLEARGFLAVCSTVGAGAFAPEWAEDFDWIGKIYVCFGRDETSEQAIEKILAVLPKARIVVLPKAPDAGTSVTHFFVTLGKKNADFEKLLSAGGTGSVSDVAGEPPSVTRFLKRAERLKAEVSIVRVIGEYTKLRGTPKRLRGWCPLRDEPIQTLKVYPRTNTFECFGCGAAGDAIRFLELQHGLTFGQALEALEKIRYEDDFPNVA